MTFALEIDRVSKRFGTHRAVEDLTLAVPRGVIYGLLGPNGAGKSTTMRMVADIFAPDEGAIRLLGGLPPGRAASMRMGFLPEERGLYPKMKVLEVVAFLAELRGLDRREATRRAERWLTRLGLENWLGQKVQELSKGMQQKVQFAACLVHDPELVILDEPWSGLDPVNAEVLRDVVRELKAAGQTVVLSTHLMEQAEEICDALAIIAGGRLVLEGPLAQIQRDHAPLGRLALTFADPALAAQALALLRTSPAVSDLLVTSPTTFELALAEPTSPAAKKEVIATLIAADLLPASFREVVPSLHRIFVSKVGDAARPERRPDTAPRGEA